MWFSGSEPHRRTNPSSAKSRGTSATCSTTQVPLPTSNFTTGTYIVLTIIIILTLFNLMTLGARYRNHISARGNIDEESSSGLLSALTARNERYKVVKDKVVYDRYARVYSRDIRFPDGRMFSFDVWGRNWRNNSFTVVAIVPFDRHAHTLTLVREYNPAHGRHVYSFPQGVMEPSRHSDIQSAAAAELEEEAHLKCKSWLPLFSGKNGMPQDKYQRESVFSFLCSDAVAVDNPAHVDDEEDIEIVSGVSINEFRSLAKRGALQSNNVAAGFLALDQLRMMGITSSHE